MAKTRTEPEIVRTNQVSPILAASQVVAEHELHWEVLCEGGCGRHMGVHKTRDFPVDYNAPDPLARVVREQFTTPEAVRCISCGPFPIV